MAIIGGITTHDMPGSGSVSISGGKARAERILICDWDDRWALKDALLGGSFRGPGGIEIGYTDPQEFPGWSTLVAVSVDIKGMALAEPYEDAFDGPVYDKAVLTVGYEPLTWEPGSDEEDRIIATETREHSMEILMKPSGSYKWIAPASNAGDPVATGQPIYQPVTSRIFTRYDLTEIPDEVQEYVGMTNEAEFIGAPAEYLMYAGASIERRIGESGENRYQVRYVFKQKDHSWNTLWHAVDETYRPFASLGAVPVKAFPTANFRALFTGL